MEYKLIADTILKEVGGRDNVISAAHCATRLRLAVFDDSKCSPKKLESIEGVKGVFFASGQLQIILGTGIVNKVYDAFIESAGIFASTKEEVKKDAVAKQNIVNRAIRVLGDVFVPIIPVVVASGFLMGIMKSLNFMVSQGFLGLSTESALYVFATIFANTAYTLIPVLVAFSAGRTFGANPLLAAVIGMIMIHTNLQSAWVVAVEGIKTMQPMLFNNYGVTKVGYQGHVIPVIIAVWILALIGKKLHKVVPARLDLVVTPLVSVCVTGFLTLAVIRPVFMAAENIIINVVHAILTLPLGIGSLIVGALYAVTVVFGIHYMYATIDIVQLGSFGFNYWLPLASAANVAQGAAALAVGLKSKDKKTKALALPSSLSALLGITEPAIFGVNLRYLKPFICACIGGGCGAMYASIVGLGAEGTGVTGIFAIFLHLHSPVHYVITLVIATCVSFVLTWFFGYKDTDKEAEASRVRERKMPGGRVKQFVCAAVVSVADKVHRKKDKDPETEKEIREEMLEGMIKEADVDKKIIYAPVSGQVIALKDVGDPTFASEMLGKGVAIIPENGQIISPVDGKVAMLFPTKHALGITTGNGVEILLHMGINTVALDGEHFTANVESGDQIIKGQVLMEMDIEAIKGAGYDTVTPVIITNSDEYENMDILQTDHVTAGDALICLY